MNAPLARIAEIATALEADHSKTELITLARAKGWKGDPERAFTNMATGEAINQKDADTIKGLKDAYILATGKTALAYYIAGNKAPAGTGATIEPTADPMTTEQAQDIQAMLDKLLDMGGDYPTLTGNYADDRETLAMAIAQHHRRRAQSFTQSMAQAINPAPAPQKAPQNDKMAQLMALMQEMTQTSDTMTREQVQTIVMETVAPIAEGMREALQDIGAKNYHAMLETITETAQHLEGIAQSSAQPREIVITTPTATQTVSGLLHPQFEKIMRLVNAGLNVLLVGGAGSGKTHLAEQIAKALNLNYGCIHGSSGASESQLTGWLLPTGQGGQFEYKPAPFVELYEQGQSLFCLDELDAFDPNMLLIANSALSNDYISIPQRLQGNRVNRGKNANIIATANTYGTGADMVYSGRNQLDGATLDRFYMVHIDYMTALEASMLGQTAQQPTAWTPASADEQAIKADMAELYQWLNSLREKVATARLRRVISTRAYQKADKARRALIPADQIKKDLVMGWTADELKKVGI